MNERVARNELELYEVDNNEEVGNKEKINN